MTTWHMVETQWWCDICGASGVVQHRSTTLFSVVHRRCYEAHAYSEECVPECDSGVGLRTAQSGDREAIV
jgi:hypothetical protein